MTRWVDARHKDDKANAAALVAIPEPVHRVSPLAAGLSLRNPKRGSIAAIREACLAHEAKCAGKYASDSLAARYVFTLSREVQAALSDVQRVWYLKNNRIAELEHTLKEWDEAFGPLHWLDPAVLAELQVRGPHEARLEAQGKVISQTSPAPARWPAAVEVVSPSRIKRLLDELAARVQLLRNELAAEREAGLARERQAVKEGQASCTLLRAQCNDELRHAAELAAAAARQAAADAAERQREAVAKAVLEESRRRQPAALEEAHRRAQAAERAAAALRKEVERLRSQAAHAFEEERARARESLVAESAAKLRQMEQQVAEAQRREREERSERVRERERHETEIARPLREALAAQTKLAANLKTENDYLRNRVKELNRLLGAFQSVIAP